MKLLLELLRKILEFFIRSNGKEDDNGGENENGDDNEDNENNNGDDNEAKKYKYSVDFDQLRGLKEVDKMTYKAKNIIKEDYVVTDNGKIWLVI